MQTEIRIVGLGDVLQPDRVAIVRAIKLLFQPLGWKGSNPIKWGCVADPEKIQVINGQIPYTWVALSSSGNVTGSVSVVLGDRPDLDLNPWVAGLVVHEDFRRRGIGTHLLRVVESYVRTGFDDGDMVNATGARRLYLDTERTHQEWQPEWYKARHWHFLDHYQREKTDKIVMCKDL